MLAILGRTLRLGVVGLLMISALVGLATSDLVPAARAADPSGSRFVSVAYQRIFDSGSTSLASGSTSSVQVTGVAGVPQQNVTAVVLDVTVVTATAAAGTWIDLWKAGTARPGLGVMQVRPQDAPRTNTVVVEPSASGQISIYNSSGSTQINIDVQGYFTSAAGGGSFHATRQRIVDSVTSMGFSGPIANGQVKSVQVTGAATSIPAGVTSVMVNVVAESPSADGGLYFSPRGTAPPNRKSMEYTAGFSDFMGLIVPLDAAGGLDIKASGGSTHVKIEVQGYFTSSSTGEGGYIADTPAIAFYSQVASQSAAKVQVGGVGSVPMYGAEAVALEVTAWGSEARGQIMLTRQGGTFANQGALGFIPAESTPITVSTIVPVGLDGQVALFNTSTSPVNVRVVVRGWFTGYRAVASADESSFLANAAEVGVEENVAKLAVWDAQLAAAIPSASVDVDIVADEVDEATGEVTSSQSFETTSASGEAGVNETRGGLLEGQSTDQLGGDKGEGGTPRTGSGCRRIMVRNVRKSFAFKTVLYKYYTYTNYCYNRSTKKVYNVSTSWNITNVASNISWEGEVNNDLHFYQWSPGVSNSGHYHRRKGHFKNEIGGIVLGNSYPENIIRTHNDSTWTWSAKH